MPVTSAHCPTCGHDFVHKGGPAVLESLEGVSDLQDRVRNLDALISLLSQERIDALRKINSIRDKTSQLPSEILSHIFQLVRPPIDFRQHIPPSCDYWWDKGCEDFQRRTYHREEDYHFDLAGVSYRWRQIILSTPQLWTSISIGVWKTFTESQAGLLDLYGQRAGNFGMSIELDFGYHAFRWFRNEEEDGDFYAQDRAASLGLLEPVFQAFTRIAPKIHDLTLIAPPWEMLSKRSTELPLCHSLVIRSPVTGRGSRNNRPVVAMKFPGLQRVFLRDIRVPLILPWTSITILELDDISDFDALEMLAKCLKLVKFSNLNNYASWKQYPNSHEPIVHENLESMIMENGFESYSRFRFSRLRTLCWLNPGTEREADRIHDTQFLSSLSSTLVSLTLGMVGHKPGSNLKDLLPYTPQLLELRLYGIRCRAIDDSLQIIGRPIRFLSSRTPAVGSTYVPCLQKLSIVSSEVVRLELVVAMLEALSSVRTRDKGFHLEVYEISRHTAASRRLQTLISSGFNVEITTGIELPDFDSKEVPWW